MNHLSYAQLNEYLDQALSPAARLWADEHLQSCHACRDRLEQAEFVFDALAGLADARLSHDLAPAVMAKLPVRRAQAWQAWLRGATRCRHRRDRLFWPESR